MSERTTRPVGVEELRARFGLRSNRAARGLMRRMAHLSEGRQMWTTEEWLAEWTARAKCHGALYQPAQNLDPLEEAVVERVVRLVGELAARGTVKVVSG